MGSSWPTSFLPAPGSPLDLTFALPIVASDAHTVRAVLGASIELDSPVVFRAARALPTGSVLTVLDSSGTGVLRSADVEHWIGRRLEDTRTRESFAKREGVGEGTSADGTVRLASYTALERVGWMAYIGIPARYTTDVAKKHFLRDLGTGVLLTLVLLSAFYALALRVVAPIESLTADARAIAAGDMTRRSRIRSDDEVGDLGTAFNTMADTVVKRSEALRKSQEALLHAQKMDAMGSFAGGITHDFNDYLSAIIGHAELAEITLDPDDLEQGDLQEVLATAALAADLTRQALIFSRKQISEPQHLDLVAKLVVDVLEGAKPLFGLRDARYEVLERLSLA